MTTAEDYFAAQRRLLRELPNNSTVIAFTSAADSRIAELNERLTNVEEANKCAVLRCAQDEAHIHELEAFVRKTHTFLGSKEWVAEARRVLGEGEK